MIREIALFRDPRMWVVVATALAIRGGFELWANAQIEDELAAYDAKQASMSPEQRSTSEAARAHAIGALVGVEVDPAMLLPVDTGAPGVPVEMGIAARPAATPGAAAKAPPPAAPARGASTSTIAAAAIGFLLVAGAGAFGAWRLWQEGDEDEDPPPA